MKTVAISSFYNVDLIDEAFRGNALSYKIYPSDRSVASVQHRPGRFELCYWDSVKEGAKNGVYQYYFPTSNLDEDVLLQSRLALFLAESGIPSLVHSAEVAEVTADKSKTARFVRRLGLPSSNPLLVFGPEDVMNNLRDTDGALVCKVLNGSGGVGQILLSDASQIGELDFQTHQYTVEQFIEGMEVSVNVLSVGDYQFAMPPVLKGPTSHQNIHSIEKVRICYPNFSTKLQTALRSCCECICRALKPNGWLEFEFICSEGKPYLIEINARVSGTTRPSYMSCGINPYAVSLDWLIDRKVTPNPDTANIAVEIPLYKSTTPPEVPGVHVHYSRYPRNAVGRISFIAEDIDDLRRKIVRFSSSSKADEFIEHAQTMIEYSGFA